MRTVTGRGRAGLTCGVAAGLAAAAVLAGCGTPRAPVTPGVVKVVAGENFGGNIAGQIGGRHVQVTSILSNPGTDPHEYEADVADALAVAEARLVIANGAGYDGFLSQLLGATVNAGRVVRVAAAIEAALARLDPPDANVFAANLAAFDASLRPVEAVIASIRRRFPGAPVAYTERVPGYLLQAAGLTVVTPPGFAAAIEDGNEPGAGATAQMFQLITGHGTKVLLYNAQAVSPVTQQVRALARQYGVPVVPPPDTGQPAPPAR